MKVSRFVFNPFGINTYVAWDEESREAMVVDPGMLHEEERTALTSFIERNNLKVTHLVNTHMHLDHIFGDNFVKSRYGVKIEGGAEDAVFGREISRMAARFGLRIPLEPVELDVVLKAGDEITVGTEPVKILSVPGHSPGSIALYAPESGIVFTGDALFKSSIGRTDLEGGDYSTLVRAIGENLLTLPEDTVVLPGHGPETTIRAEKHNPYLFPAG